MRFFAQQNDWRELKNDPVTGISLPSPNSSDNLDKYGRVRHSFYFNCTSYQAYEVLDLMSNASETSPCRVAMGAIAMTKSRYDMPNIQFSIPYTSTGLGVLVLSDPVTNSYDMWGFLRPFNWTLWTALLATLLTLPIVIFIVENLV